MKKVKIIDYFSGNIFSVTKAFEHFGCEVTVVNRPEDLGNADFTVLPGVGAFGDGMRKLRDRRLVEPILDFIGRGKPFLGICLGMQLLFSYSEEFGRHKGLGVIPGGVIKLREEPGMKIPHIGWNSIEPFDGKGWNDSILDGVPPGKDMYFVHSFAARPERDDDWMSRTPYGSGWFCSGARRGNVFGCQFHPEKSGEEGLRIIDNFLGL